MHYMCQQGRLTSFQHGKEKTLQYTHQCIMVGFVLFFFVFFTLHKINYTFFLFVYMVIFIHDSFKLNVTTVERQARMKWTWVDDGCNGGRKGGVLYGVMFCRRDVMR